MMRCGLLVFVVILSLLVVWDYFELATDDSWQSAAHVYLKVLRDAVDNKQSDVTLLVGPSRSRRPRRRQQIKFYIIPMPEITTWLLGNYTEEAYQYYDSALNEEQAEVWLHRGLERLGARTNNHSDADVVIVPGYLHLNHYLLKKVGNSRESPHGAPYTATDWLKLLEERLVPNKTHVLAVPTWNPTRGREIRLEQLQRTLKQSPISVFASFGFERNPHWQKTGPTHIIPVPYVVKPSLSRSELRTTHDRARNYVFYSGDARKNAVGWAGCNRTRLVSALADRENMHVRIVSGGTNRLTQDEYNNRMLSSDYCLILCGDTPTSRSLASSMLYRCTPLFIGSRWRGLCNAPCKAGWGWVASNLSHLPFQDNIDWNIFPELDEAAFALDPVRVLEDFLATTDADQKKETRSTMERVQMAWTYGWGNPVNSTDFGEAADYVLDSLASYVASQRDQLRKA